MLFYIYKLLINITRALIYNKITNFKFFTFLNIIIITLRLKFFDLIFLIKTLKAFKRL